MTNNYDAPISRGMAVLICVFAVFIVLLAALVEEGPKWLAKAAFTIERMETATEQAIYPELKVGTIASHNIDWLRQYYQKKRANLPLGIFETGEGWYVTDVVEKTDDDYVKIKVGGPNDFAATIWIKEITDGKSPQTSSDRSNNIPSISSDVWSAPEGV